MSESVGTAKTVEPTLGELTAMLEANRVFEELGSQKECQALIDNPRRLLFEKEVSLRLRKKTAQLRKSKVYIFEDYLIVATRVKAATVDGKKNLNGNYAESTDSDLVWFGSEKSDAESVAEDIHPRYEFDLDAEAEVLRNQEMDEVNSKKQFNLKMWIELGKIKPRFLKSDGTFGVSIVYVSKVQEVVAPGEYRFNTVVDCAEIWMENESAAKTILGLMQDVVDKKARDMLVKLNAEIMKERQQKTSLVLEGTGVDTDSEGVVTSESPRRRSSARLSTKSGTSATIRSKSKRREALRNKKRSLKILMAHQSLSEEARQGVPHIARTYKDLQAKYAVFDTTEKTEEHFIADENEGKDAEFAIHFRGHDLGISLQDAKGIEPFVAKLTDHGLAKNSGVILGDRVVAINDVEITTNHTWADVKEIIVTEREDNPGEDLVVIFRRKQKTEQARIRHEIEQREAIEQARLEEEQRAEESDDGAVNPVEENASTDGDPVRTNSVEFRRKTEDGSKTLRYTLVKTSKGKGKRKWHRKKKFLDKMQELNVGNFDEFRKNKSKLFERFENNGRLFDTVLEYCGSKEERNCIHALREIYEQEDKYNGYLNHLKGFQRQLLGARKQVICKQLKSGRPFCEHMRPRRYCSQESSVREEAIDHKILNAMFLNLSCIVKTNQFLWNNLQSKLAELYAKAANHEKVEMYEMLEVFCNVFTQIAPFLQMYWAYCNRLNDANEYQRMLRADNPYYRKIVKPLEKKIGVKLPNLMVKPLQQSMRYHLLFDTLRKHVTKYLTKETNLSESHQKKLKASLDRISVAHEKLVELGTKINKLVGKSAADEEFLEIYEEIGGDDKVPNLMEASRRFISKTYIMYEDENQDLLEEQSFVYLFNDKLVLAVVRPLPTARGSKFSLNLRVAGIMGTKGVSKKRISIDSIATDKKMSLPKRSGSKKKKSAVQSETLRKKLSMRLSNGRSVKSEAVRMSSTSKDSKGSKDDIYFDIIHDSLMKQVDNFETCSKQYEAVELYGIKTFFTALDQRGKEKKSSFFMWFDLKESRDAMLDSLTLTKKEYLAKRERELKVRESIRKNGGHKKNSAMPHNKMSTFSTGTKG